MFNVVGGMMTTEAKSSGVKGQFLSFAPSSTSTIFRPSIFSTPNNGHPPIQMQGTFNSIWEARMHNEIRHQKCNIQENTSYNI